MSGRSGGLLASPFRLFFLLAGCQAIAAILIWLGLYLGHGSWGGPLAPVVWHGHEMLFGYTAAVIAGFILTAAANWTQTEPWSGPALALAGALWLLGRLAWIAAPVLPAWLVAAADLPFMPVLAWMLAVPVLATGNRRQLIFIALFAALTAANLLIHLEALGVLRDGGHQGMLLATTLIMLYIAVLGGRVIPMFTGNALRARGETEGPRQVPMLEKAALLSLALVALVDLVAESGGAAATVALTAAAVHGLRLAGWRGSRVLGEPILWVLHLGYGWLVLGLALKGLAALAPDVIPPTAALHALTAGAIGTLTIGIMSRVTLGHTGRPFKAAPLTVAAYWLVTAAALLRVGVPIFAPGLTVEGMELAIGLWGAAFALFLIGHTGMLTGPRVDGRPG
ncbi:MAG: NnrS family protein [Rhodospirillaceae bacterium]